MPWPWRPGDVIMLEKQRVLDVADSRIAVVGVPPRGGVRPLIGRVQSCQMAQMNPDGNRGLG